MVLSENPYKEDVRMTPEEEALAQYIANQPPSVQQQLLEQIASFGSQAATEKGISAMAKSLGLVESAQPTISLTPSLDAISSLTKEAVPVAPETGMMSQTLAGLKGLGYGPQAGIAAGLILGAKGVKDLFSGKETKGLEGWGGRATLGIATGGLSEVARLAGLGRKSTSDYQDERWGALNPAHQGLREANHGGSGTWDTGKYAGQKWTFEKALDLAKEDPTHFQGVLGNLETFGDNWVHLDDKVQKNIVADLVANNKYVSDKGDVLISDQDYARGLLDKYLGREFTPYASKFASTATGQNISTNPFTGGGSSSNPVASRYGDNVASQVAAAIAAGKDVGSGGAGYEWNGKEFVRK